MVVSADTERPNQDETLVRSCFACHQKLKKLEDNADFVFNGTRHRAVSSE